MQFQLLFWKGNVDIFLACRKQFFNEKKYRKSSGSLRNRRTHFRLSDNDSVDLRRRRPTEKNNILLLLLGKGALPNIYIALLFLAFPAAKPPREAGRGTHTRQEIKGFFSLDWKSELLRRV